MVTPDPSVAQSRLWGIGNLATADSTQWRIEIYGIDPIWNSTLYDYNQSYTYVKMFGELLVYNQDDEDSNGRIGKSGIKITDFYNKEEDYEIGLSSSSEIEFDLINDDGYFNSYQKWNWMQFVYASCWDEDNNEWIAIPLGSYALEKPTKTDDVLVHVKGYDNMQRIEQVSASGMFDNLTFTDDPNTTATLNDIYNAFIARTNQGLSRQQVEYVGRFPGSKVIFEPLSSMYNDGVVINANIDAPFYEAPFDPSKYNCRQVLEFIAAFTGTNAFVSRNGHVKLRGFESAFYNLFGTRYDYTITVSTATSSSPTLGVVGTGTVGSAIVGNASPLQYGPTDLITWSKRDVTTPVIDGLDILALDGTTLSSGTGKNKVMLAGNPLFNASTAQTVADELYTKVSALQEYTPMSFRCIICPTIEAGDVIKIVNGSITYNVPIFQQTLTWTLGTFKSDIVCSGLSFRQTDQQIVEQFYDAQEENAFKDEVNSFLGKVGQSLWSGSWSSGDITVSGMSDYNLFMVTMDGQGTNIIASLGGTSRTYFRGIGGYASSSSGEMTYYLAATLSGDTLTMVDCHSINQAGTRTARTVTEIIGLL